MENSIPRKVGIRGQIDFIMMVPLFMQSNIVYTNSKTLEQLFKTVKLNGNTFFVSGYYYFFQGEIRDDKYFIKSFSLIENEKVIKEFCAIESENILLIGLREE